MQEVDILGRYVTLDEVRQIAEDSKDDIWALAKRNGREPKIYLHWTAGSHTSVFDDYHINITGDGQIYISTDDFADVLSHTYMRNSGAVGITLCCAYGASLNKSLWDYPPTEKQIEVMAQVVAVVAKALWLTIDMNHVMTHSEAADNIDGLHTHEPYGAFSTFEKWDLLYLCTPESPCSPDSYDDPKNGGNVLRGKAVYYSNQL